MKHIMQCSKCKTYTMQQKCSKCNAKVENPKPVKYSPADSYGSYRRKAKEELLKGRGLL